MSDLVFACRQCAKKLVIDEAGLGAQIACPDCATNNVVPTPTLRFRCPTCGAGYGSPGHLKGDSINCPDCDTAFVIKETAAAQTDGEARTCVECGASVPGDAQFCVKCGVNQRTGLRLKPVVPRPPPFEQNERGEVPSNPVLERLTRPRARQPSLVERSLPIIKAVALLSCIMAAAMVVWHYSRQRGTNGAGAPVPADVVGTAVANPPTPSVEPPTPDAVPPVERPAAALQSPQAVPPMVGAVIAMIESLRANPADAGRVGELVSYIASIEETNETRNIVAGLKALYGLGEVESGRTERGLAACAHVQANYADTEFAAAVMRDQFSDPCARCARRGVVGASCAACAGKGLCSRCGGRGSVQVVRSAPLASASTLQRGGVRRMQEAPPKVTVTTGCSQCEGGGRCLTCKGGGQQSVPCPDCRGVGTVASRVKASRQREAVSSNTIHRLLKFAEAGNDLKSTAVRRSTGLVTSVEERPDPGERQGRLQPSPVQPSHETEIHYVSQLTRLMDETFVALTEPAPDAASLNDFMHECSLKTGDEEKVAAAGIKLCQHLRDIRRERERRVQQYQGTEKKNYAGLAPSRTYSRRCSHWGGYYGLCDACRLRLEQQQAEQKKAEEQASERKNFYLTAIVNNWNTYESAERARCDRELEAIRAAEVALRKGVAPPSGVDTMAAQP